MKNKLLKKISIGFAISLSGLTLLSSALFLTSCSDKDNTSNANTQQENQPKPQAPNQEPKPDTEPPKVEPENPVPSPSQPTPPVIDKPETNPTPSKPVAPKPDKDKEMLDNAIKAFNEANLQLKELSKSDMVDIKDRSDGIFTYLLNMPNINRAIQKATTGVPVQDITNHTYTFTITLSFKSLKANTKEFVIGYQDKPLTNQELCEQQASDIYQKLGKDGIQLKNPIFTQEEFNKITDANLEQHLNLDNWTRDPNFTYSFRITNRDVEANEAIKFVIVVHKDSASAETPDFEAECQIQ